MSRAYELAKDLVFFPLALGFSLFLALAALDRMPGHHQMTLDAEHVKTQDDRIAGLESLCQHNTDARLDDERALLVYQNDVYKKFMSLDADQKSKCSRDLATCTRDLIKLQSQKGCP